MGRGQSKGFGRVKLVIRMVGKLRDKRIQSLCDEYLKRAQRHISVTCQAVSKEPDLAQDIPPGGMLVAMDPIGALLDTPKLIDIFEQRMLDGQAGPVIFAIGGAEGLSDETRRSAHLVWSLTPLTLPHRLAHLLLCEQIYRAISHIRGEPYNRV